jgi:hypothetical protein
MHATLVTGASGMAWSLLLFFSYQTRVGALYSQLGALTGVFMCGLAMGGAIAAWRGVGRPMRVQAGVLAAAISLSLGLVLLDRLAPWPAWAGALHLVLLGFAGVATGSVFPTAAGEFLAKGADTRSAAAAIELADHAGAAIAALCGAVVFLPALGLVCSPKSACGAGRR